MSRGIMSWSRFSTASAETARDRATITVMYKNCVLYGINFLLFYMSLNDGPYTLLQNGSFLHLSHRVLTKTAMLKSVFVDVAGPAWCQFEHY